MTPASPTVDTVSDRVQLPFFFDAEKMAREIEALQLNDYVYYKTLPLRAPAHIIDPSIPFPPPADDYADGSWTEWLDSSELQASPYLNEVVNTFRQHTKVTLVRLLSLAPGATIKEHTDPTLGLHIHKSVVRLTIPIKTNDTVQFFLNDSPVPMQPGECWYLRLTDPHRVINPGATERINMSIDMIPNEWLTNLIISNQKSI